ncbi:MAG: tripartite tricarboxylate transporter substrate binding protein [Burkholderiales bacterium]|nr:tripartite tricarboxylate transporter substrate binding protein [Burkholderiales bacterium]
MNPRSLGLGALLFALAAGTAPAQQAAWPVRPIKAVVPFAPGAATDTVARTVLERVSRQLGQPIVIENRPGAGGTIGSAQVAQAEPDGYTILVHSNSHTVTEATYRNLSYSPSRDLTGVMPLASVPMVIVTSPQKGVRTLQDLVRNAKARPDSVIYASAGAGGATHLGAERLRISAGFTATHVPYKGSAEALTDVIAGRVDYYFSPIGLAMPHLQNQRLVALAVSSSRRSGALAGVATTVEAGFPNSQYDVWIGMFAPARTPRAILARLNEEAARAVRSSEVRERFAALVMDEMVMGLEEFNSFLAQDFQINAELVKAAGVQPN